MFRFLQPRTAVLSFYKLCLTVTGTENKQCRNEQVMGNGFIVMCDVWHEYVMIYNVLKWKLQIRFCNFKTCASLDKSHTSTERKTCVAFA
jgi:hypothetical protein